MFTNIYNFIKTKTGNKLLSILLGISISALFRETCKGPECILYTASKNIKELENNIYEFNDKCYIFKKYNITFDPMKKTVIL
jgi:hypothetical protein